MVWAAGLAGRGLACGLRLSGPGVGGRAGGDPEGGERGYEQADEHGAGDRGQPAAYGAGGGRCQGRHGPGAEVAELGDACAYGILG